MRPRRNAVHFSPLAVLLRTLTALLMLMGRSCLSVRRFSGKLLILRLTQRRFRRCRRGSTRSWRISSSTASWKAGLSVGGNGSENWKFSTDDADGVQEGKPIRIIVGFESGFVH